MRPDGPPPPRRRTPRPRGDGRVALVAENLHEGIRAIANKFIAGWIAGTSSHGEANDHPTGQQSREARPPHVDEADGARAQSCRGEQTAPRWTGTGGGMTKIGAILLALAMSAAILSSNAALSEGHLDRAISLAAESATRKRASPLIRCSSESPAVPITTSARVCACTRETGTKRSISSAHSCGTFPTCSRPTTIGRRLRSRGPAGGRARGSSRRT